MPVPQHNQGGEQLGELLRVLTTAVEKLAVQRDAATLSGSDPKREAQDAITTTAYDEYDYVKVIRAVLGSLESLVLDPHTLLLGFSSSYLLSRALHIVAEQNIAEHLAGAGHGGLHISHLARLSGIDEAKLCRHHQRVDAK